MVRSLGRRMQGEIGVWPGSRVYVMLNSSTVRVVFDRVREREIVYMYVMDERWGDSVTIGGWRWWQ